MSSRDALLDDMSAKKARDRLSGALSSAITLENDLLDGIPDLTAGLDSPLKRIINSNSPWGSPTKSPRQVRRRRKKEVVNEHAFHHTFVMKLFDRSLDLAQFNENTALYPVARAWMRNQPHNTNFAPRLRTPTPEPQPKVAKIAPTEEEKEGVAANGEEKPAEGGESAGAAEDEDKEKPKNPEAAEPIGDEETNNGEATAKDEEPSIYKLPTFVPLDVNEDGVEKKMRIPEIIDAVKVQDFEFDKIQAPKLSPEDMLQNHMLHWVKVRKSWKDAAKTNEDRYKDSMAVIQGMFES